MAYLGISGVALQQWAMRASVHATFMWFSVKPNIAVETIYKALDMVAKGIGLDEKHRHKKWRRHAESLHDQGLVLVHVQIPRELESELYEIVHDWRERKEELNNERAN